MLALLASLLIAARPAGDPFVDLAFDAACKRAAASDKLVFVDFFTTWCEPCQQLDATTWKDADVHDWLSEYSVALKIDAEAEQALAQRYDVRIFPTLLFVHPDGREIERVIGYVDAAEFIERAGQALAGMDALQRAFEDFKGRENDPSVRQSYARALVRAHSFEQALEHFLWCFDHGLEHGEGYRAVRNSFLLRDIVQLGREFPRAIAGLRERRDRAREHVQRGTASYPVVSDYIALNRVLGNVTDSMAVLDELKRAGHAASRAARLIADMCADTLLEARRYADLHEIARHDLRRVEKRLSRFDDDDPARGDGQLARALRASLVHDAAVCYEVLLGLERIEEADRALELIAAFDASRTTFELLLDHALHAGASEGADRLVAAARAHLSETDGERLQRRLNPPADRTPPR